MLCLAFVQKKYFLCWADANNMENGVREEIITHLKNNGCELVEMFTSDTLNNYGSKKQKWLP